MSSHQHAPDQSAPIPSAPELRVHALAAMLTNNGYVEQAAIGALLEAFAGRIAPDASTNLPATPVDADLPAAQVGAQAMLAIPKNADGPVFREIWEALAFGLALALVERGAFTWVEWADIFGEEIMRAGSDEESRERDTYYSCWLAALESMAARKGLADAAR